MLRTPLHDEHVALGARMVDFAGWRMPVQYGSILEEVAAVRGAVGLFDLSHMGRIFVSGRDATAFLDSLVTTHCARIPVGAIRYGLLCREDGGPIDDLLVYREPERWFLVVNASNRDADLAWMRAHARAFGDVAIDDRTDALAMLALQGPRSQAVLEAVSGDVDLGAIKYYRFGSGTVCGLRDVAISRTGYTGEDGFEVYVPATEGVRVWRELLAAGGDHGLAPIGLGARDTLRLEAGMALYGHEIDPEHNPVEAGLSFGISFAGEKGDWVGRAALLAVREAPRRRLLGMTTAGPRVPRQGYELYHDGRAVGAVASGAVSPTLGTNIASVYVEKGLDEAGRELEMDVRGKRQPCRLQELPFYSRTRK